MTLLSAGEAASLLGVVEQTVRNYVEEGRLVPSTTAPLGFAHEAVRSAKVLREADMRDGTRHAIPKERILKARIEGIVIPGEDGRFSLDDIDRMKAWDPDVPETPRVAPAGESASPPKTSGSIPPPLAALPGSRREMVRRYLVSGASPNDLPDEFWLTPRPPAFCPPRDCFREAVQSYMPFHVEDPRAGSVRSRHRLRVWRSGYYRMQGGTLSWTDPGPTFLERDAEEGRAPRIGEPPAERRFETHAWHEARKEWLLAWEKRAPLRRLHRGDAGGHLISTLDALNRGAILFEYHMFFDSPGALPPEFWEGGERPPFEAPTNAGFFRLGRQTTTAALSPQPITILIRAAGWFSIEMDDGGPIEYPEMEESWVDGHFEPGDFHPTVALWNAEYVKAEREWDAAWQRYQAFCRDHRMG